jgi:hypothetical protein
MRESIKFRRYAEDCRRLAKYMKPEHRTTLLEIAEAWDRCAETAERGARNGARGDDSDESIPDDGTQRAKRNRTGRPPPRSERSSHAAVAFAPRARFLTEAARAGA